MGKKIIKDTDFDLWILLVRTYHLITRLRELELNQYGVLPTQSYILVIIQALGKETTQARISRYVYQQRNTVSDLLKRMEKKGLITRTKKSDHKTSIIVKLTEKGKQAIRRSIKRESIHTIMSKLSKRQREQLQISLELMTDNAIKELSYSREKIIPPSELIRG